MHTLSPGVVEDPDNMNKKCVVSGASEEAPVVEMSPVPLAISAAGSALMT